MSIAVADARRRRQDPLNASGFDEYLRRVVWLRCARVGRLDMFDDAVQEAWVAAAEAAERFDLGRGVAFMSFCYTRLCWRLEEFWRRFVTGFTIPSRVWRVQGAQNAGTVSLDDVPPDRTWLGWFDCLDVEDSVRSVHRVGPWNDAALEQQMDLWTLDDLIGGLSGAEREIVCGYQGGRSCAEMAAERGATRQAVHAVLRSGITRMRERAAVS